LPDKAVPNRIIKRCELQYVFCVPDALRVDDDPPLFDFRGEVSLQTFNVVRRGLNRNYNTGAAVKGMAGEHANISPAIQDNISFTDIPVATAIQINLKLS
jgi:hypothetical protein